MKSARVSIFRNDNKSAPNQPDGSGLIELPAQFIAELAQVLQTGQFSGTNQQGEPFVSCRVSVWRADGTTKLILSGQIESPGERAAYLASKQQQGGYSGPLPANDPFSGRPGGPGSSPAQGGWGQPPAQQWGQPPQGVAPAPQQPWGAPTPGQPAPPQQWGPPQGATPQPMPMQQPAPTDAPAF
jgi:hypothetical protein